MRTSRLKIWEEEEEEEDSSDDGSGSSSSRSEHDFLFYFKWLLLCGCACSCTLSAAAAAARPCLLATTQMRIIIISRSVGRSVGRSAQFSWVYSGMESETRTWSSWMVSCRLLHRARLQLALASRSRSCVRVLSRLVFSALYFQVFLFFFPFGVRLAPLVVIITLPPPTAYAARQQQGNLGLSN